MTSPDKQAVSGIAGIPSAHTPGPWVAWDDGRTIGIVDDEGEPIAIAEVVDYGDQADEAQIFSDQRLIAAAPDLLENAYAARDTMARAADIFESIGKRDEAERLRRGADVCRALIAKALGQ